MRFPWLIVDGYSLLHRPGPPPDRGAGPRFGLARDALVRRLERLAGRVCDRMTIVFDGRGERVAPGEIAAGPVEVLFSPATLTADSVIERLVLASQAPAQITVITSDRLERETVEAAGAQSLSCGDFLALCEAEERALARPARPAPRRGGATLGDIFPG